MDTTFSVLKSDDKRSQEYHDYRKEWDDRELTLNPGVAPLHLDIELSAKCDLKCGSTLEDPKGFCQIWTHEHIRKQGFDAHTWKPGLMSPELFCGIVEEASDLRHVRSIKLNYRGEPTLHPDIVDFVDYASNLGTFADIMINTNGNGGARSDPTIFAELVAAGVVNLMFSVDACDPESYAKQRVNGNWDLLLNSVRSAIDAKSNAKNSDCRIRASVVRTKLNKDDIDSGRMESFWVDYMGVDWLSISDCYFPGGTRHPWAASTWVSSTPADFRCADPFRRMVITWDGRSTFPCCQGFSAEVNGGSYLDKGILGTWHSDAFNDLRKAHITRSWDKLSICRNCPLTHRPV